MGFCSTLSDAWSAAGVRERADPRITSGLHPSHGFAAAQSVETERTHAPASQPLWAGIIARWFPLRAEGKSGRVLDEASKDEHDGWSWRLSRGGVEDDGAWELVAECHGRWTPFTMLAVHAVFESVFWKRTQGEGPGGWIR